MAIRPLLSIGGAGRWRRRLGRLFTTLLAACLLTLLVGAPLSRAGGAPWKVATDPAFPPFEFRDPSSGRITGFDVDLIEALGRKAGHPIQLVPMPFDGIIPALQARNVDAAISAMTITAERARAIEFSRPYFEAGMAIVVRENGPRVTTLKELQGRRIAVQIGTTGALTAGKVAGARVSQFDSTPLALQELANGNVDAVVSDEPAIRYAIQEAGIKGLRISGEPLTRDHYGIALPSGSPIAAELNRALASLISDGGLNAIHRQWLGTDSPPLPEQAPALRASRAPNTGLDLGLLGRNLLKGAGITLLLTVLSFSFGLVGGTSLAMLLQSPWVPLRHLCRVYIDFFRGTPMLVQLFLIYFGLPALLQAMAVPFTIERLPAAVIALSLNVAAYLAEVLRSGIESIDRGQWEAADALGFSPLERMRFVVAPQAIRRVLPPLANEFITLIKDTSLAAVIGFDELFRQGQLMVATTYRAFEIYIAVALVYLLMTTSASLLFKRLERKLSLPA